MNERGRPFYCGSSSVCGGVRYMQKCPQVMPCIRQENLTKLWLTLETDGCHGDYVGEIGRASCRERV